VVLTVEGRSATWLLNERAALVAALQSPDWTAEDTEES
jgi:hypothetical protein